MGSIPDHRCALLTYKHIIQTVRECIIIIIITSTIIIIIIWPTSSSSSFGQHHHHHHQHQRHHHHHHHLAIIIIIITVITIIRTPASACTTELVSRLDNRVGFRVHNGGPNLYMRSINVYVYTTVVSCLLNCEICCLMIKLNLPNAQRNKRI